MTVSVLNLYNVHDEATMIYNTGQKYLCYWIVIDITNLMEGKTEA